MMEGKIGCTVLRKLKGSKWIYTTKNWIHSTLLGTLTLT